MGRSARPSSKGTIFDEAKIGLRIEQRRAELGLETKAVYTELGWTKGEYSRKTRGLGPIWMAEYAELHRILRGWTGFPFVDKAEGEILDALRDRLPEILRYLAAPKSPKGER